MDRIGNWETEFDSQAGFIKDSENYFDHFCSWLAVNTVRKIVGVRAYP